MTFDSADNLYGTTTLGGLENYGVVYRIDAASHQETILFSFTDKSGGANPYAGTTLSANGDVYGTTSSGGLYNAGVVYKIIQ